MPARRLSPGLLLLTAPLGRPAEAACGIWRDRGPDGLAAREQLRSEWIR